MGHSANDPLSPVSPLYPRHYLSLSSSGEDLDDIKLASRSYPDPCAALVLTTNTQQLLKNSMKSASNLQHALERQRIRTQGVLERLPQLEDLMKTLFYDTTTCKDLQKHINIALRPSASVIQLFDKVHMYEVYLSKGPKGDIGRYIQHMSMLKKLVAGLESRCPIAMESLQDVVRYVRSCNWTALRKFRLHKLLETSFALGMGQARQVSAHEVLLEEVFKQLETEFRRILTVYVRPSTVPDGIFVDNAGMLDKNSSIHAFGTLDKDMVQQSMLPSPVVQLLEIVAMHLAEQGRLMKSLKVYEDVRGLKLHESFLSLSPSYLNHMKPKALDALQWATLEEYMTLWNRHMFVFVKVFLKPERVLFDSIFFSLAMESGDCVEFFSRLAMKSGLGALLDFGECFAKSQKEPQKIFKLLDMLKTLDTLYPSLQQICSGDNNAHKRIQELQKRIVQAACAVFWEFGLQVEVQREGPLPEDGGVLKLVSYVINYLKFLISDIYRDAIAEALRLEQRSRGGSMNDVELSLMILQIMESLQRNVEYRSHMVKEPALSCVFRMNNYWYIYTRSANSDLGPLLGDDWLNEQRERVEHIALQYQREAWGSMLSYLSMEGLQGGSNSEQARKLFRSRIEAFEEALADMHLKHSRWWFPSPDLRQQIEVAVLQMIVPAYESYVFNCSQLLQQGVFAHSQFTAEALEHMLISLFTEKPAPTYKKF